MNFSHSTTVKTEKLKDTQKLTHQWDTLNWDHIEHQVNRLQTRIAKAMINNDENTVKRLQYLLTHSFYAKVYAVKKVTTNKGKNTSGVDKELWSTSASKMKGALSLNIKNYRAKPLRRVYIAKKGKNKKRPLGIPTMYDRCMQTLYALALEPIAETTADTVSFGFRKYRSAKDACEQIFNVLARKVSPVWILEGDIKGCFDNINHEWLLANIPMDKQIMRQFLKSGFIYQEKLFQTDSGTPQGGAISSIYANMALDGLEKVIQDKYHRNSKGNIENHYRAKTKVNLVRYADDFIITAKTREIALEVKEVVSEFLNARGLTLSEEKTIIAHIEEGFDFLGWTFRKFKGKLIIKPSKESIKSVINKCSTIILKEGKASTQDELIIRLNQVIRGWSNYHRHTVASYVFSYVNNTIYLLLQKWALHRHRRKGRWWRLNKYWKSKGSKRWVFKTEQNELINLKSIPIIRHPNLKISKHPFIDQSYFIKRKLKIWLTIAARESEKTA
ncbi:MAG: group II intron reverse transcriptase/maturase [Defluviitaleaceae bacterium]|nr:group II intron reverse transcriptase/maturase [Defluviitaleaceae bacterium]